MSDNNDEYEFTDDGDTDESSYEYDDSESEENYAEAVIIVDESSSSAIDVSGKRPLMTFASTGQAVDGMVTVVHLDDDGQEHTQVIDLASPELTADEAKELTTTIKTQTNVLYLLIARAHAGKAHIALGYKSFEEYIKQEFNYSKSYAYKLLDQARIIDAISEVMPEGTQVYVSDATARGLKASMSEFVPELEGRVRDLPADEAAAVMEDLVQEYREKREEEKNNSNDEFDDDSEFSGEGTGGGGEYSGDYNVEEYEDEEDEEDDAFGGEDNATVRRRYEAVYNLYSALAQFSQMPPNDDIVKTIPPERQAQVTAYLDTALTWLSNFKDDWYRDVVDAAPAEGEEGEETGDEDDEFNEDSDDSYTDDNNE